jgi:hypothetical protein
MTDDTEMPSVDEILYVTLHRMNHVRRVLTKTASQLALLDRRPTSAPLVRAQSEALTVGLGAVDDAQAAMDRATAALSEALQIDDPPRP